MCCYCYFFLLLILQNETTYDSEICYLVRLLESQNKKCFRHVSCANTTIYTKCEIANVCIVL